MEKLTKTYKKKSLTGFITIPLNKYDSGKQFQKDGVSVKGIHLFCEDEMPIRIKGFQKHPDLCFAF